MVGAEMTLESGVQVTMGGGFMPRGNQPLTGGSQSELYVAFTGAACSSIQLPPLDGWRRAGEYSLW